MAAWAVALIVAAVVSAAAVGVSAATGKYEQGGVNDAFGDFFKYTMLAWGGSLVGQGVGAAAGDVAAAGSEGGMTAAEIAAAEQAGSSAQLASAGANAASGVGTAAEGAAEVAMAGDELAMMEAEMAAADYVGPSAFDAAPEVGLSAANTTGQNAPSLLDSVFNTNSLDFKKALFEKLVGEESYANYESLNGPYTDLVDEFIAKGADSYGPQEPVRDPQMEAYTRWLQTRMADPEAALQQFDIWGGEQAQFDYQAQNQPIGAFAAGGVDVPEFDSGFDDSFFGQQPSSSYGSYDSGLMSTLLGDDEGDEENSYDMLSTNLWYA